MTLIAIGKTNASWIKEGIKEYSNRMQHYGRFSFIETSDVRTRSSKPDPAWVMKEEAKILSKHVKSVDHLILMDEQGKAHSSIAFAQHLEKLQVRGLKHIAWVIGGPYGFDPSIHQLAQEKWSLGPMTFSHQMIRPFAIEQIYRAHTILKGEPYHHI